MHGDRESSPTITFVNRGSITLNVLVYYGQASGSCTTKPFRRNFSLLGGDRDELSYGPELICYASDHQGPPIEGRVDGQANPGSTVYL